MTFEEKQQSGTLAFKLAKLLVEKEYKLVTIYINIQNILLNRTSFSSVECEGVRQRRSEKAK